MREQQKVKRMRNAGFLLVYLKIEYSKAFPSSPVKTLCVPEDKEHVLFFLVPGTVGDNSGHANYFLSKC